MNDYIKRIGRTLRFWEPGISEPEPEEPKPDKTREGLPADFLAKIEATSFVFGKEIDEYGNRKVMFSPNGAYLYVTSESISNWLDRNYPEIIDKGLEQRAFNFIIDTARSRYAANVVTKNPSMKRRWWERDEYGGNGDNDNDYRIK